MSKTIQVRKPDTIEEIEKLQERHNLSTATNAIDLAVSKYSSMERQLNDLHDELRRVEKQLQRIKTVVRQKQQADRDFQLILKEVK